MLVVAIDAAGRAAALGALTAAGAYGSVQDVSTPLEALSAMLSPGTPPRLVLLAPGMLGADGLDALHAATDDPFVRTRMVQLPGSPTDAPADLGAIQDALSPSHTTPPAHDAAALRQGLAAGEIAVRFQPIVRVADRRPVALEALARWEASRGALGPGAFVAMAEDSGLGSQLSTAVARRAAAEFAPARGTMGWRLAVNLPLATLLEPASRGWLALAARDAGLRPGELTLELTETSPVRDRSLLRRALLRLGEAGYPVALDDLCLGDGREALLNLPFSGFKLDRSTVLAMPESQRARAEVHRLVRLAEARGMCVTAEGISSAPLWRAIRSAGVHRAQGFAVGRPMPAPVLTAWARAWAKSGMRSGQQAKG